MCDIEFWYARELQKVLEYTQWRNFNQVIDKSKVACDISNNNVLDHFADVSNMVELGSGAQRNVEDIMLSRYACYLVVQNSDSRKEVIALGQTYFAVKTRERELEENYEQLTEEQGVGVKEIHGKKGLKKSHKILDYMGSRELAANLFRATQTDEK